MSDVKQPWLTESDLAERMGGGITPEQVATWRLAYGWPSVKVGRQHRFTEEHVAEIVRMQESRGVRKTGKVTVPTSIPGQTQRSSRRSA